MNQRSWEAATRSAAFGVELHNQIYDNLRAVTRQALAADGVDTQQIMAAGDEMNWAERQAAMQAAQQQEQQRLDTVQNALFVSAAISMLPRTYISSVIFTNNAETVRSLLDTVMYPTRQNNPWYVIGYRYSDTSALLAQVLPHSTYDFEYFGQYNLVTERWHTRQRSFEIKDPTICSTRFMTYQPAKKNKAQFQAFIEQDFHVLDPATFSAAYDRKKRNFRITKSNALYQPRANDSTAQVRLLDWQGPGGLTTDLLNEYGVLDLGLVRLMAHFEKGNEYIGLMKDTQLGYLENIMLPQQQFLTWHETSEQQMNPLNPSQLFD